MDDGYRWGRRGKVYRGKGAKRKAFAQGAAIRASQKSQKRARKRMTSY